MSRRLMHEIGVQHVGVADTIGVGTPEKTKRAMAAALQVYELADGVRPFSRHYMAWRRPTCMPA